MIALYDMDDNLFSIFDNQYELAKYLGKPTKTSYSFVCPNRINLKIRHNGKWYKKILIEVEENVD